MNDSFYGELCIIGMRGCEAFTAEVDNYIKDWRRHVEDETYIAQADCPRFGSGEAKGLIHESMRGRDVYIICDVFNYGVTYKMYGMNVPMSPDDHYQDLKRIIAAVSGKARRINVIMPMLYEGRQHRRTSRESLDCALCLQELAGMGVENLLEMLTLTAEVGELKANPNRAAQGTVIEARLDKGRGPVATLLVQNGTLHQGDIIIAGTSVGRVRAMVSDKGQKITSAGPSVPVEITGLSEAPSAGATFNAVADEKLARELVEQRKAEEKAKANAPVSKVSLEDLFSQIQAGEMKNLNLIVKADVQGSVEAVKASLEKLSNDEVRVRVIHGGVGAINESDVMLASTSQAIIVGFNVRPDAAARDSAARANVDMRMYRVIYDAINEIEAAMKGMLAPKYREALLGHAEVRQTYKVSGVGTVAGCYVQDGKIQRKDCQVRLVRDGIVIHEGVLASLQRFKDQVKEVASGYECGLTIEKFNDIKEGDIIEAFTMEEIPQ